MQIVAEKQYKIVVVGCGGMSNAWISNALKIPGCSIVGLVDVRREAAAAQAQKYNLGDGVVFDTLQQALETTKADLVFDVTVPGAHHEVTLTALKNNCHILGEKPLSDNLPHAQEMVSAAKKVGKLYAVMQNRRFDPNIRAVRKAVQSGAIGEVEEVHADFFIGAHFGGFRDVMEDVLIVDMAIHTFDQGRFICGCDPVSVYCHSSNPKHSWYKGHASATCIFEMSNGVVFTYRGSWCAEGLQTSWESNWRVVLSKGTLLWDGAKGIKAAAVKPDGKHGFHSEMIDVPVEIDPLPYGGHDGLIRDFIECLQTGRTPMTICDDNIKSLAMVMAAVESRKTGKKVAIKW